ncbi:MAG: L,D-transpeptidase family protein, partial [Helicobacter sp.]|nr:L,D-transpeptidase family protein [Helicobacter sp.]
YLFLATKDAPILKLYEFENNKWQEKLKANSLVGSKKGDKLKEGDLATPIGVYTLNARLTNLDQYYGPLALTTSYPNLYDRLQMRTGYGIWIHGMPLDGNRENLNTRGCIAIENNLLVDVDKMIDYKKSLLITFEHQIKEISKEDLAIILADLFTWRESWINNDAETYLSFYDKEFIRYDRQKYKEFAETKRRIFKKNESKKIEFSQINISPYPNDEERNLFRIGYHQDYKAYLGSRLNYSSNGAKELYIELKNGKMQILAEQ